MGQSYCFKKFLNNNQFQLFHRLSFFFPRGHLHFDMYICTSHVGSSLFQDIRPFVLDLPPSFQAEIGGGTWLVIWPDDSSNLSPAHTSTHRQTKWSYAYRLFIVLFLNL